jgi:hypothetical protein
MTYFKPIEATCERCRNDKRRRIYRVRHNLAGGRNRVTIFCEHSRPHQGPSGLENAHVTQLLKQVRDARNYPTSPTPCVQCGRTIQQRGWIELDTAQRQISGFLSDYPMPRNFVCGIECFKKLLAAQARKRRAARPQTVCRHCAARFVARRGAKFCSTRCRVAAHRQRRRS